ncbi:MAG TPA: POTRA domain-containing protein [Vicinamibacterales bacterium]|nr:POTRA domain-containing protein [Vicinamibacterales bacterium]
MTVRFRRIRLLPAAMVLVLMAVAPVFADVADYLGRPVVSVRLTFEGRTDRDSRLRDLIMTPVGAPLGMADVRETVTHLMSLGQFQDVRVHAAHVGAGVALVYQLIPLQRVGRLRFDGDLGLSQRTLRTAVTDRYGLLPPLGRAAEVARMLLGLYREHGYLRADVTPRRIATGNPELVTLAFEIQAGIRARIRSIRIAGKPSDPAPLVIERLGVRPGEAYDATELRQRIARYTEQLRTAGYYEARLVPSTTVGEHRETVALTITVNPGPHVTTVFEGDPLPLKERDRLVPIRQDGSVDEDLLEDSSRRIQDYFRAQGYRDAAASFSRRVQGDEMTIVFQVHHGPLYRIAAVQVTGNTGVPLSSLPADVRLREGTPFVQERLDAMAAALELRYRQLGYSDAKAERTVIPRAAGSGDPAGGPVPVAVRIVVHPGVRTLIDDVAILGNDAIPEATLRGRLLAVPGRPFYGPNIGRDADRIQEAFNDRGYESATVTPQLGFNADRSRVAVRYVIQEGPQIFVDHVLIVGNTRTSTKLIERELLIEPGQPLNLEAIGESQRRLVALGLFRRVRIEELRHGSDVHRDVLVSVEEAPTTTIGYGGGVEVGLRPQASGQTGFAVDRLEFAPRALFEITRRNLFGKNRSISLFSRVSLRPNTAPFIAGATSSDSGGYGFSDYRVIASYREPRLFGSAADAVVSGVMEQGVRASFNFAHRGVSAQVARRLTRTLSITGNYAVDRNRLFDEQVSPADQLLIDRLFPQVLLSSFSSSLVRDTRDDAINPTRGGLMVINGQIAGRAIGSEVGFAKAYLQGSMYRTVPGWGRTVFAADARLGLATGFPRNVPETDSQGNPVIGPNGQPIDVQVRDLPASERFFAGGDTTVRGFALDQLGTPATIDANGFPQGGDALIILNAELRIPVWRAIGVVGFVDAGNVWAHVGDLNPAQIRAAVGFGLRYESPIGPIRIDLGFKLSRVDLTPGRLEPLTALNISLGQAF